MGTKIIIFFFTSNQLEEFSCSLLLWCNIWTIYLKNCSDQTIPNKPGLIIFNPSTLIYMPIPYGKV